MSEVETNARGETKEEIIERIHEELGDAIPSDWDTTIEDWAFEIGSML